MSIFSEFVNQVTRTINYKEILLNYENHYNLRKFKITEIPADSSFSMFQHIVEKYAPIYSDFTKTTARGSRGLGSKIS